MKKGFTLIELLAVIVILAIIALIATPIVLNIISDTKESATIRSAENYIRAVEQAVVAKQFNGQVFNLTSCTTLDNGNLLCGEETLEVSFNGNKPASGATIRFNKGSVVGISNFKMGDNEVLASTLGLEETIYRWTTDTISIGDIIDPTDYTTDPSTLEYHYYLKHVLDKDNKVIESYACAKINNNEVCLRGGSSDYYGYAENEADYIGNAKIMKHLQDDANLEISCTFSITHSNCDGVSVEFAADLDGRVATSYGDSSCYVVDEGVSACNNF